MVTNNLEETASLTTEEACSSKIPPECHNTEHYNLIELQSLVLLTAISYCALKVHILDSNLKPFSSLFLEQFDGSKLVNVERSSVSSHTFSFINLRVLVLQFTFTFGAAILRAHLRKFLIL